MLCAFAFVSVGCKKSKNGIDENLIERGYFVYYGKYGAVFISEKYKNEYEEGNLNIWQERHFDRSEVPLRFRKKEKEFYVEIFYMPESDILPPFTDYEIKYIKEIE